MEQNVLFFCIKCNQLKTVEQADVLFRTGFYRVHFPLGCCTYCEHQPK